MNNARITARGSAPRLAHHEAVRGVTLALAFVLLFAAAQARAQDALAQLRAKVKHIVVVYQENWSFDSLYGRFPGANGIANASPGRSDRWTRAGSRSLPRRSPSKAGTWIRISPPLLRPCH